MGSIDKGFPNLHAAVMAGAPPGTDDWRARARSFADREVLPLAAEMDRIDRFPPNLRGRLASDGLLGIGLPKEWGGSGGDSRAVAAVLEELARASAAVATMVSVHVSVVGAPLMQWGDERLRREFLRPLASGASLGAFALTEPGAGSDAASIATRYHSEGPTVRLDGSKTFITNAASADTLLLFARKDGPTGPISAFVVPRETAGLTSGAPFDKLGLRGSETVELALHDVRIPADNLVGPEGHGLKVALTALTGGRVGIAACALGVAQAGFDCLRRIALQQRSDADRTRVAQAYVDLQSARLLVEHAAALKDAGARFIEPASAAKLAASRAAMRITTAALEADGRAGGSADSEAGRLWRDARVFPIVEGTSEIQELILGRALLERPDEHR